MGSSQGTGFRLFRRLPEAPHLSLAQTLPELERTVAAHSPEAGCDALCDRVLASRPVVDPSLTAPVPLSRC